MGQTCLPELASFCQELAFAFNDRTSQAFPLPQAANDDAEKQGSASNPVSESCRREPRDEIMSFTWKRDLAADNAYPRWCITPWMFAISGDTIRAPHDLSFGLARRTNFLPAIFYPVPEFIGNMNNQALLTIVLIVLCLPPFCVVAQDRKVHFALTASGSIKYPFLGDGSRNYHLFGEAGTGVACPITGTTEESLSFLPKLSLVRENTGYHEVSTVKYVIETVNLVFNPEVLIPTRSERWKVAIGIGIDWMADMTLAEYGTNRNLAGTNLDAIYDTIYAARKPVIPFVSAGVVFQAFGGLHIQGFLRQDLMDAFPPQTIVTFNNNSAPLTVNLSHIPTRPGLGLMYIF